MPFYDYVATEAARACDHCRGGFEARHGINDKPLAKCPECGAPVRRAIGVAGICTRAAHTRQTLSDKNLKEKGFKKLVKQDDGRYRDVL